ncbi:MAG TPA: hypothetical protein VLG09_03615 [Candidatus Saccharimonadales bacterium]|nr:hypothetical protein [Candidatus Saccharimonadales bacterium]
MHALDVKHRQLGKLSLTQDLAHELVKRVRYGKIVVVADNPIITLSAARKQWLRLERKIWSHRASTIRAKQILELTGELAFMQRVRFSAKVPDDLLEADITFATASDLMKAAPECKTMYVTYEFPKEELYAITSWMPPHGLVVIYDGPS